EARELTRTVAARYGMVEAEAERFPLMLIGTVSQLRERLAERIALLDLGYVVLQFPSPSILARFGAEGLPVARSAGLSAAAAEGAPPNGAAIFSTRARRGRCVTPAYPHGIRRCPLTTGHAGDLPRSAQRVCPGFLMPAF